MSEHVLIVLTSSHTHTSFNGHFSGQPMFAGCRFGPDERLVKDLTDIFPDSN